MHEKIENCLAKAKQNALEGNRNAAIECVKEALVLDPGEMLITEVLLSFERDNKKTVVKREEIEEETTLENETNDDISTIERISSKPMDAKLEKIFQLSEKARESGDDVKAIAYLKKARKLYPDNSDVEEKLNALKTLVGASNLVSIGLKALDNDDLQKAVAASRKAFNLDPNAARLQELISRLEELSGDPTTSTLTVDEPVEQEDEVKQEIQIDDNSSEETQEEEDADSPDGEVLLWADRIRRAVQDDEFEEAGKMVGDAIKKFPHDELLNSFYSKLKRLGFAK